MLSSRIVLASSLFSGSDISRLLADTQTSSLRSQQAIVDVVSRGAGAWPRRSSPFRSPSCSSPSRRKLRESGSFREACALQLPGFELCSQGFEGGFSEIGVLSFVCHREVSRGSLGGLGVMGGRSVGCGGPVLRLQDPFSCPSFSLDGSDSPSQLFSNVHPGNRVERCSDRLDCEGSSCTHSFNSGLLQPVVCYPQSHCGLAPGYRSLAPKPLGSCLSFSHGDGSVGASVS